MTGSIACYKACGLISKLVQNDFDVQVVASESALQFVGNATLEGLSGKPVLSDLWARGHMMEHINLVRWADLILVAPATANFMNKIAHGIGDDLLTTLFLAHDFKKPFLLAPAMNTTMYLHPTTQSSAQKLKDMGIEILETASGVLACGETGLGKLLEPELIYSEITKRLAFTTTQTSSKNTQGLKVLITSGGTQEPLDDVRVLTNKSTGSTGARIADRLAEAGFDVTLLHAESAQLPQAQVHTKSYVTFEDLSQELQQLLKNDRFAAVIHAAAVSDFSLDRSTETGPPAGKISSSTDVVLKLRQNPKLVNQIKELSPQSKLFAFKMTSTPDERTKATAVEKLFQLSHADFVIHNDMSEMDWRGGRHLYHWCSAGTEYSANKTLENVNDLSDLIVQEVLKTKDLL